MRGRAFVGTSGFAYPAWAPTFYPSGTRGEALLRAYAARLAACELNNTFYQQPRPERIERWLAETPSDFRFAVKAQRGGSTRALTADPVPTVEWLTTPYRLFGTRLGTVLYRVPRELPRDEARLDALLSAWPPEIPLALEFQDPSWLVQSVLDRLTGAGVAWVSTDLEGQEEPPRMFLTGPFLYLRLRRETYADAELREWAARVEPFLASGVDAYVFLRHDESGASALRAMELRRLLEPPREAAESGS